MRKLIWNKKKEKKIHKVACKQTFLRRQAPLRIYTAIRKEYEIHLCVFIHTNVYSVYIDI